MKRVVIEIPEEMYKWVYDVNKFFNDYGTSDFIDLIKNGTPLPEHHSDLVDKKEVYKKFYCRSMAKVASEVLNEVHAIIPATKEGAE